MTSFIMSYDCKKKSDLDSKFYYLLFIIIADFSWKLIVPISFLLIEARQCYILAP